MLDFVRAFFVYNFSYFYSMRFLIFIIFLGCSTSNEQAYIQEIELFQEELNQSFYDIDETPLRGELYENFKGHPFFPIREEFKFEATFERIENAETIEMLTSSGESKTYLPYAKVHFDYENKKHELTLFQSQDLKMIPEYEDYLFLPFKDLTNGDETYAGGRYLDLKIPENSIIIIDFNKAYQPYCAYNIEDYSCPIVPEENQLKVRIPSGVKYNQNEFKF